MITYKDVSKNPYILEFIKQTKTALNAHDYTDHGINHVRLVADRARSIANEIGLSKRDQELAAIASFCHDMGNFLSRRLHNYLGAMLFQQIFPKDFSPKELSLIMKSIVNHDKAEMKFTHAISAILVLADKSDVRRSRVIVKNKKIIQEDIHNRVNFAVTDSHLRIDKNKKLITLTLKIDTNFVPIMDYFEIFTDRMTMCRKAARHLKYRFGLVINNFKLL